MRAVIQRVSRASVTINGQVKSAIGQGFLILLGVCEEDTPVDVEWLVKKISMLRVFDDENGVMNCDIHSINGEALVVSQFTLFAIAPHGSGQPAMRFLCRYTKNSAPVSARRLENPWAQANLVLK